MLPGIGIYGKADYYDFIYSNISGPDSVETSQIDISGQDVKFSTPLDIRLGTAVAIAKKWKVALDLAYRFGIDYSVYNDPRIDEEVLTQGNFRANAGFVFEPQEKYGLHGGLAYSPTTLENTNEQFGENFWSFYAGAKSKSKYFDSSFGLFYSLGRGQGALPTGEGVTNETYQYYGVVLGTNYRF